MHAKNAERGKHIDFFHQCTSQRSATGRVILTRGTSTHICSSATAGTAGATPPGKAVVAGRSPAGPAAVDMDAGALHKRNTRKCPVTAMFRNQKNQSSTVPSYWRRRLKERSIRTTRVDTHTSVLWSSGVETSCPSSRPDLYPGVATKRMGQKGIHRTVTLSTADGNGAEKL